MKKSLLFLLLFLSIKAYSQTLKVEKDEFTGVEDKTTSWEELCKGTFKHPCFPSMFRFRSIEGLIYFDYQKTTPDIEAISKGNKLMLKLDNNEIVELEASESKVSCIGCWDKFVGSESNAVKTPYSVSKEQIEKLLNHKVVKLRVYFNEGYKEEVIGKKRADKIINALKLII